MKGKVFEDYAILRVDKGEEVLECLEKFLKENNIRFGSVTGLGASNHLVVGLYHPSLKKYVNKEFKGDHEITNFTGNIAPKGDDITIHMHVTFADENQKSYGGHLESAVISATCELVISIIKGKGERFFDEDMEINRLSL